MRIKADKEGIAVLTGICDAARRACQLKEVGVILTVLNSIQEIEDENKEVPGGRGTDTPDSPEVEEREQ